MVFMLPVWVMPQSLGLAYGYAILQGEAEERLVAWTETATLAVQVVVLGLHHPANDLGLNMVLGLVELGVALSVMLRSDKCWPLAYCAVVLVSLMTLGAAMAAPVSAWAYGTAMFVWNYVEILVLVLGTWRVARDRRRGAAVAAAAA